MATYIFMLRKKKRIKKGTNLILLNLKLVKDQALDLHTCSVKKENKKWAQKSFSEALELAQLNALVLELACYVFHD